MTPILTSNNVYEILGVERTASVEDVRKVYRRLALQYHPDMVEGSVKQEAAVVFTRITKAYDVLQDEQVRRRYDHLLDRGVVPDLDHEVGDEPAHRSVTEILGQIRSLDIDSKVSLLVAQIDADLYRGALEPSLYRGQEFQEQIVDVVGFRRIVSKEKIDLPGRLTEGWLVLTDLRVLPLYKYCHKYTSGNVQHQDNYIRIQSFMFLSMKDFLIHEHGRVSTRRFVELADEDGRRIKVDFPAERIAQLLLVAGAYQLPLKVRARADRKRESLRGLGWALAPLWLWCIPFLLMMGMDGFGAAFDRVVETHPRMVPWFNTKTITDTYESLTGAGLTALAFFVTPLACLIVWQCIDQAWKSPRGESVFGHLPIDYALGSDAITQARGGGGPLTEAYVPPDDLALGWLNQRLRNKPWGDDSAARTPAVPRDATAAAAPGDRD